MKRIILLSLLALIAGCATKPLPVPVEKTNYCAKNETTNCRAWTPGEIVGPGSRGHSDQPEEPK